MDEKEVRLRCIEAAKGLAPLGAEQVVAAAEKFYAFVVAQGAKTLGLPKK